MITYTYQISASTSLDGSYETLEGEIKSHYPIPYSELRDRAMLSSPDRYITFGVMRVIKEEESYE